MNDSTQTLQNKLDKMTEERDALMRDLAAEKQAVKEMKDKQRDLIKKTKVIEEKEKKLSQQMKPKLLQAIDQYKYMYESFNQIKQDTELLPMIFKAESAFRARALEAQQKAEADSKIAVDKMSELENRISNLEKDKAKAIQLSMMASAARS